MKSICVFLTLISTCSLLAQGDLTLLKISDDFSSPVAIANDRTNNELLYVVERQGVIRIINDLATGAKAPVPFLDISERVTSGGERGLLGMEFHPDYPDSPYFFVNYTFTDAGQLTTRVSRFEAMSETEADDTSERIVIQIEQPFNNHNAGDLKFGPDGYLYIPLGDGGSGGDPQNFSQDPTSLLGSMLRLDITNDDFPGDVERNYAVPLDNPFVGVTTHLDEIWSFGWRNPWRFSFDSATDNMWVADVGQNTREEISFEPAGSAGGGNYGWSCMEGFYESNFNPCFPGPLVDPIFDIIRSDAMSITGGYVYRGMTFPTLAGFYFAADFVTGEWWRINSEDVTDVTQTSEITLVSTFGTSVSGELYCATIRGEIYRIMDGSVCPDQLTIVDHPEDTYSAEQEIVSTATVESGRDIRYSSPEILLESNFTVASSGALTANSDSCLEILHQAQH